MGKKEDTEEIKRIEGELSDISREIYAMQNRSNTLKKLRNEKCKSLNALKGEPSLKLETFTDPEEIEE